LFWVVFSQGHFTTLKRLAVHPRARPRQARLFAGLVEVYPPEEKLLAERVAGLKPADPPVL
jgi:hypothetical protein